MLHKTAFFLIFSLRNVENKHPRWDTLAKLPLRGRKACCRRIVDKPQIFQIKQIHYWCPYKALTSHLSPLTSHLSPLTSPLSPLTSHLSPLPSPLSPLPSSLSPLPSSHSPLLDPLSPLPDFRISFLGVGRVKGGGGRLVGAMGGNGVKLKGCFVVKETKKTILFTI